MKAVITTPRLLLRELLPGDAEFILTLVNSPGWLEFIGNRNIHDLEDAKNYMLTGPMSSYVVNGFGLYLVERKADSASVGLCGLVKREYLMDIDLGVAFLPEFEGQGMAAEAALAVLDFARTTLSIPKVVAITTPHNQRSIKLLTKIGMLPNGMVSVPGTQEELLLFSKESA